MNYDLPIPSFLRPASVAGLELIPDGVSDPLVPKPTYGVYSTSGFDVLPILSRLATRKNPQIRLGPVDFSCAFVVVDTTQHDHPIVYVSESFTQMTGYFAHEIVGQNCRFLQAPKGTVRKGDLRTHTSNEAVEYLKRSLSADRECQVRITNYRKDGTPFTNLLTIIPLVDETGHATYHVGLQIDADAKPDAITDRRKDGSYVVNYQQHPAFVGKPPGPLSKERKAAPNIPRPSVAPQLKRILANPEFIKSIPITGAPDPATNPANTGTNANHPLSLILLEVAPGFRHVVSLKGAFLWVAPNVRRILGYEPSELVGKGWSDLAHKEDIIPLLRELKESSSIPAPTSHNTMTLSEFNSGSQNSCNAPRPVDLLFRARTKFGRYVWIECKGQLHNEPGKSKKAIMLTAYAREMHTLPWYEVQLAGGLAKRTPGVGMGQCNEFWGFLGRGELPETMSFMTATRGIRDVLGYTVQEAEALPLQNVIICQDGVAGPLEQLSTVVSEMRAYQKARRLRNAEKLARLPPSAAERVRTVRCQMLVKNGRAIDVVFVVYRADRFGLDKKTVVIAGEPEEDIEEPDFSHISTLFRPCGAVEAPPLIYQVRILGAPVHIVSGPDAAPFMRHDRMGKDVFEVFSLSRGTSWQYELQQMKANRQRYNNSNDEEDNSSETASTPSVTSHTHHRQMTARPEGIPDSPFTIDGRIAARYSPTSASASTPSLGYAQPFTIAPQSTPASYLREPESYAQIPPSTHIPFFDGIGGLGAVHHSPHANSGTHDPRPPASAMSMSGVGNGFNPEQGIYGPSPSVQETRSWGGPPLPNNSHGTGMVSSGMSSFEASMAQLQSMVHIDESFGTYPVLSTESLSHHPQEYRGHPETHMHPELQYGYTVPRGYKRSWEDMSRDI